MFELKRTVQFVGVFAATILISSPLAPQAQAKELKIVEKTKFYTISGKTAAEFARSMSKNGPYSRAHRARTWATASRDLSYQLVRRETSKGCSIKNVSMKLDISYTMPKPRTLRGVSKKQQNRWRRMYQLLVTHEKVHGRYYKQFARELRRALLRMKPARSCRALDRKASAIVDDLSAADNRRNRNFDQRDGRNYRRMTRLYSGS